MAEAAGAAAGRRAPSGAEGRGRLAVPRPAMRPPLLVLVRPAKDLPAAAAVVVLVEVLPAMDVLPALPTLPVVVRPALAVVPVTGRVAPTTERPAVIDLPPAVEFNVTEGFRPGAGGGAVLRAGGLGGAGGRAGTEVAVVIAGPEVTGRVLAGGDVPMDLKKSSEDMLAFNSLQSTDRW